MIEYKKKTVKLFLSILMILSGVMFCFHFANYFGIVGTAGDPIMLIAGLFYIAIIGVSLMMKIMLLPYYVEPEEKK